MTSVGNGDPQAAPTRLPTYAELAGRSDGRPPGSSWGVFGDGDEVGTINLLDAARVLAGVSEVVLGQVHSLNWRFDQPTNPWRPTPKRVHTGTGGRFGRDDHIEHLPLQFSSQWDGLRHVRQQAGFYNGVGADVVDDHSSTVLGIHHWAERGIAGRGVLLDVARQREAAGRPFHFRRRELITADELDATAAAQGTTVAPGDVLLVRTGWAGWYEGLDADAQATAITTTGAQPGLADEEATAAWLWDHRIAAVASDNTAVEPMPLDQTEGRSLHQRLISGFGMALGEHFWLDGLAEACAADGRWSFLFTSAPLNVPGGVGSPPNALALR